MTEQQGSSRSVVKMFTKARNFPQLIGKAPDGRKIPGGPYTLTQFVGAGIAGGLLWLTQSLWAQGSVITNGAIFLGITGGTLWVLGRLPQGARNPISVVRGVGRAATGAMSPSKINGEPIRIKRPHAVLGSVIILDTPPIHGGAIGEPTAARAPRERAENAAAPVELGNNAVPDAPAFRPLTQPRPERKTVPAPARPRADDERQRTQSPALAEAFDLANLAPASSVQQLLAMAAAAPTPTREKA